MLSDSLLDLGRPDGVYNWVSEGNPGREYPKSIFDSGDQ
jgi:hypothetical protein